MAVIGNDVRNRTYKIGKKSFISIAGERFEVIGVLDEKNGEWLKDTVIIPLQIAIELYGVEGQYYIDGSTDNINKIVERFEQVGTGEITAVKLDIISSLIDFYKKNNDILHVYVFLFILLILILIVSVEYCTVKFSEEYKVYKILGFSDRVVFCVLGQTYLKLIAISNVLSLIIADFILKLFAKGNMHSIGMIFTFLINSSIIFMITIRKIKEVRREVWR